MTTEEPPIASADLGHVSAEFLVEPFTEGGPGAHVRAAIDAATNAGLQVDVGPFASTVSGEPDKIAGAMSDVIRAAMAEGATRVRIQVGEQLQTNPIGDLHNALGDLIRSIERELDAAAGAWDRGQKQAAVRMLSEHGAFLLRGSVEETAEAMGVSRITIYNYLNAINADGAS